MPQGNAVARSASRRLSVCAIATAAGTLSPPALASFNGPIDLPPTFILVAAAVFAVPGAVLCALIEWIGARRRPPPWIGAFAAALGIYCAARALGLGPRGDVGYYLFPVPPLLTLALVALVPAPRLRLIAVWTVSLTGVWLLTEASNAGLGVGKKAGAALPLGGALVTLSLWQLAFMLRQASLRRAGISWIPASAGSAATASAGPDATATLVPAKEALARAVAALWPGATGATAGDPATAVRGQHRSLGWFAGGAAVFHVGVTLAIALGFETVWSMFYMAELRVIDLFGVADGNMQATPTRAWVLHGLPWSLLFGCLTWGWAACAGLFDAGRLAPLRLAAAIVPLLVFALLLATSRHGFL